MNLFSNYDQVDETCFLCGEDFDVRMSNQEHFFPKWILSKYSSKFKEQRYFGNQGVSAKTDFWRQKLQVHQSCNEKFGEKLEQKIRNNNFNDNEIWLWSMKIVCGLIFHEAKFSRKKPDFNPAILSGFYDDDLVRFWEVQDFILGSGKFLYGVPFTVFELDYVFPDDEFFHTIDFSFGVFWIAFNKRSYLVFYNQQLSNSESKFVKDEWERTLKTKGWGAGDGPMFKYRFFTAKMAIEIFFAGRKKVWNPQMLLPAFDRPERTPELEIEFYKRFGFELTRNNDGSAVVNNI